MQDQSIRVASSGNTGKKRLSTRSRLLTSSLISAFLLGASVCTAQADESEDIDDSRTMAVVVVTGEMIDTYDVLPDRPTDSVYGTSRTMSETPRSVTLIESSLIDLLGVRTVNDFVGVTPGSFTGNYFGVPGALDLRGERADNFFRGFRRIENRGNFPTSVAAAEYVEVIKGPPPTIYGGGKVGGILNFAPQSAKSKEAKMIDSPMGAAAVTVGTYDKKLARVEFGAPFKIAGKDTGAYLVVEGEDSGHYYDDIYNKNILTQLAFDTELSSSLTLEYGMMAQIADLNQSLGWNRVTQELIDSEGGMYLGGSPALYLDTNGDGQLSPSEIDAYDLEQFAFTSPFPYGALTPEQMAAFALDPSTVGYVPIDHHTVQVEESDFSKTDVYTAYFDVVFENDSGLTVKNQTFYDTMDHYKFSSYGFTADYEAYAFENKTTVSKPFTPVRWAELDTVAGASFRISEGIEQESRGRGFQVLDRRDISVGATPNDRFEGAYAGTGNVPYNWVQDGKYTDFGVFGLIDATLADDWSLILGARWDQYEVDVYGTDTSGVYASADDSDTAFSYNASLSYEFVDGINAYVTQATSEYLELGQGGIVARPNVEAGNWLQDSELLEFGLKGYVNDEKLYFNLVYYDQERSAYNNQSGTFDGYTSDGVELELRYAATENLSFTGAATWQETELQNAPFFLGVPPSVLGLDPVDVYGGRFVAVGSLIGIDGPLKSPTPDETYSFNAIYDSKNGWGGSFGATHVSAMQAGFAGAVDLPSYTVTRAAIFFDIGDVEFRINANNLFDEKYYTPQFLFWDSFISPSVGRTVELSLSYAW